MPPPDSFPAAPPANHDARLASAPRLAALAATELLDSLPEAAFDRVVRLATQMVGAPVGLFSLVTPERQFFKAQLGLGGLAADRRETPLSHSFCQYVVSADQPLAVADARESDLLHENGAVRDLGVIAYLGVPIHGPGGAVLGSLCAIDGRPRDWSDTDLAVMRDLGAVLETEILLRHEAARRQVLLAELVHRTRNLFAIVGAIVRLAKRAHQDAGSLAADLEGRFEALSSAHGLVLPGQDAGDAASVTLEDLLRTLLAPYNGLGVQVVLDGPEVHLGGRAMTGLALGLHEMATNSAKYGAMGDADGRLDIRWRDDGTTVELDWLDQTSRLAASDVVGQGGFGSQLLELTIAGQLGGAVTALPGAAGWALRLAIPRPALAA